MGFVDIIKGLFIAILGILAVFAITLTIYSNTAKGVFFDPNFYFVQFEKADVYRALKTAMISVSVDTVFDKISSGQLSQLPPQTVQQLKIGTKQSLDTSIPLPWIKTQTNNFINNTLRYLKGESSTLNATLSIKEIKPQLSAATVSAVTAQVVSVVNISEILGSEAQAQIEEAIKQQVETGINSLPDAVDLNELSNGELIKTAVKVKPYVTQFFGICNILLIIDIVLLLLIALLTWNVRSAISRIGWCVLIAGVLSLVLAFILPSVAKGMMTNTLAGIETSNAGVSQAVINMVTTIAVGILDGYFDAVKGTAAIVVVVGVILVALSFALRFILKERK